MLRIFCIAAIAAATSLAPLQAQADDCMCATVQMQWGQMEWRTTRMMESLEVGPLFSSDGTMLVSAIARAARAPRPAPSGRVLWCASADDPRCAPRDSAPNHGSQVLDGAHIAFSTLRTPRIAAPPIARRPFAAELERGRAGFEDELERPPRR